MPRAQINGQGLHYTDTGNSEKDAIVFLHGFLMDGRMFASQIEHLRDDYRCVTFDARVFGQTEWDGEAFDLYDTVSDCIGLMDHLGIERAVIAGMSQGGYAALRLALRNPERVAGLVLMSTSGQVDPEMARGMFLETRDTWAQAGPVQPLVEGLAGALLGPKEKASEFWDTWLPRWKEYPGQGIFHGMNNLLDRDDIEERLGEITQPVLLSHGTEDVGMPIATSEFLAEKLPGVTGFVRIEGAAHTANMTHPEQLEQPLATFLKGIYG